MKEFPDSIDLNLAECLENDKAAVLPSIQLWVEIGGPLPDNPGEASAVVEAARTRIKDNATLRNKFPELVWSANPGPAERHLRRQHGNVLFPPERRIVGYDQINFARQEDQAALRRFIEALGETLEKVLKMPHFVSLDDCKQVLDELDELRTQCLVHSPAEATKHLPVIEVASTNIVAAMKKSVAGNIESINAFEAWRETVHKRDALAQNSAVLEVRRVPEEDFIPTVCSLESADIRLVLQVFGSEQETLKTIRAGCADVFAKAISEGFPSDVASARLHALGVVP